MLFIFYLCYFQYLAVHSVYLENDGFLCSGSRRLIDLTEKKKSALIIMHIYFSLVAMQ